MTEEAASKVMCHFTYLVAIFLLSAIPSAASKKSNKIYPFGLPNLPVQTAVADPKVSKYTEGKSIRKVIFVPSKILNLIVG